MCSKIHFWTITRWSTQNCQNAYHFFSHLTASKKKFLWHTFLYGPKKLQEGFALFFSSHFCPLKRKLVCGIALGVLTFCVVSLVILQTRSYEQHARNFTMLQNGKYLCCYGSKRHKMFPLDRQYDARPFEEKKIIFYFCCCLWALKSHF